jgi:hypothetical protein
MGHFSNRFCEVPYSVHCKMVPRTTPSNKMFFFYYSYFGRFFLRSNNLDVIVSACNWDNNF